LNARCEERSGAGCDVANQIYGVTFAALLSLRRHIERTIFSDRDFIYCPGVIEVAGILAR